MIDELTVHNSYGAWKLAEFLNEKGYKTRSGDRFTGLKISRILKDPYYCGRLEDGSTSDALQALRLRSDETYDRIMYIMEQRSKRNEEKRHVPCIPKDGRCFRAIYSAPIAAGG